MKKGQKVVINLSQENAQKLGIQKAMVDVQATVVSEYTNGVPGHNYSVNGKIVAIADRYNAAVEVE